MLLGNNHRSCHSNNCCFIFISLQTQDMHRFIVNIKFFMFKCNHRSQMRFKWSQLYSLIHLFIIYSKRIMHRRRFRWFMCFHPRNKHNNTKCRNLCPFHIMYRS